MSLSKENLVHLESFLESFEDPSFNTPQKKMTTYQEIKDILKSANDVKPDLLDRLLKACTTELKPDVGYLPNVLNAVIAILEKREQLTLLNLVPSAQAIVHIINSIATLNKIGSLKIVSVKTMCFNTLLAYPNQTLDSLVKIDCRGILKIIEFYCSTASAAECRDLAFQLLIRLMKALSPETKSTFVTSGVDIWFLQVVPTTISALDVSCSADCIGALELLTDSLVHVDYSENQHWLQTMECIYNMQKYPTVMKDLLEKRNDVWHRLWIVLIRLLKEQITKMSNKSGSPVNALLPIVENAFKLDVNSRILAFKCWDALIDNFSSEKNEAFVMKRLKLLIIPLRSPNAKVEETAEAKINTWWHLIRMYHNHMGKLTSLILMPFIHCCFGSPEKSLFVPGLITDSITAKCVQALVELFGHVNCDGCVKIPPLKGRLINTVILVEHWKEWLHALKIAIKFAAEQESDTATKQLSCIWKSLLLSLAELPANKIRSDIFDDVLMAVERLLQCNFISEHLADQIYNVMITSMFDQDKSVLMLLNSREDNQNGPIHRILKIILDPVMGKVIGRKTHKDLKLITDVLLDKAICNPNQIIEWVIQNLPHSENSAVMWSACAESICETEFALKDHVSLSMVMWPLKSTSSLVSERSTKVYGNWKTLFSSCANLTQYDCDEMLQLVQDDIENGLTAVNFKMCVTLALLKQFAVKKNYAALFKGIDPFNTMLSKISSYKDIETVSPMLLDTLVLIIKTLKDSVQVPIAEKTLSILHVLINLTKQDDLPSNDIKRFLLKPLNEMFQIEAYLHLKHVIVDDLIKYLATDKQTILKINVLDILKTFLSKCKDNEKQFLAKVQSAICRADDKSPLVNSPDALILKNIDINSQKDAPAKKIEKLISAGNDEVTLRMPKNAVVTKAIAEQKVTLPVKSIDKINTIVKLHANQTPKQPKTTPAKVVDIVGPATNKTVSSNVTSVKITKKATIATTTTNIVAAKVTPAKTIDIPVIKTNDKLCKVTSGEVPDNRDATKTKLSVLNVNSSKGSPSKQTRKGSKVDTPTISTKINFDKSEKGTKESDKNDSYSKISDAQTTQNNVEAPIAISTETSAKTPAEADAFTPEAALAKMFADSPKTKNNFTKPNNIEPKKKSKKKETSIVNTVVENGEEYAVVKSNWKFNPRKLTEHQKEKLREKRSDIPALYQDYSQSQDEIKLATWKTDSQDTSTTSKSNSNSTSDKDFSGILKNLPSSDVVPKIMENILTKKVKDPQTKDKNANDTSKKLDESPAVKSPRTPRMALKDRVFKNMRHLMVKSGLQDDKTPTNSSSTVVDDINLKTPNKEIIVTNSTNSAPPKLNSDRPSRLIKKPRKFEDSQFISLIKKRRRSVNDSQSDSPVKPVLSQSTTPFIIDAPIEPVPTLPASLEIQDTQPPQQNTIEKSPASEITATEVVTELTNKKTSDSTTVQHNDDVKVTPITENDKPKLTTDSSSKTLPQKTPKSAKKQSRIEKQLLIDMVEGNPLLQSQTPPRATKRFLSVRKRIPTDKISIDKKHPNSEQSAEGLIIIDDDTENPALKKRRGRQPKARVGRPLKVRSESVNIDVIDETTSVTVLDSQNTQEKSPMTKEPPQEKSPTSTVVSISSPEKSTTSSVSSLEKSSTSTSQELASSEDIIESSQDSSITTISVKSSNQKSAKKVPVVRLDLNNPLSKKKKNSDTQEQIECDVYNFLKDDPIVSIEKSNEDIELPKNKSVAQDVDENILTENMDTEPFSERHSVSNDCIVINDELSPPILIGSELVIGTETQEIAEADTEPFELQTFSNISLPEPLAISVESLSNCTKADRNRTTKSQQYDANTQDDLTQTFIEETPKSDVGTDSSPIKDKAQKNKEFLNDTLEISPIKTLSPLRDKNTPSPETSRDYVVIKLNSPVQFNGEPFEEKCDSPEVFTEDKTSPEKRDQSPPREEVKVTCGSPSSLSLKKNRTKVGSGSGRAAQIMGLCAPSKAITVDVNKEGDQSNKCSTPTPKTNRNLRILQNNANDPQDEPMSEDESEENFLKFKRLVPTAECSPSGPILKRKLADIADDTTISPASKRKRVSFHDPPVSTTIAVHKYIEPGGIRSPQSSTVKRQERQARGFTATKSQRRLDNIFKLDNVLIKAIEHFTNEPSPTPGYSEQSSIEQTPAAEVVTTSELNNTDPICPDLLDCKDPISNIAGDLSSPAMKHLLIKELAGKVETVADLAKMTELEVNRLCIKAPKVKVAQQVLSAYAALRNVTINDTRFETTSNQSKKLVDMEAQTSSIVSADSEMQTEQNPVTSSSSQTEAKKLTNAAAQTNESGNKSTDDITNSCLSERPDFMDSLAINLGAERLIRLADHLPFDACLDLLMSKTNPTNRDAVINRLLKEKGNVTSSNVITQFTDLMCRRFQSNELILLCSKILEIVHKNNSS